MKTLFTLLLIFSVSVFGGQCQLPIGSKVNQHEAIVSIGIGNATEDYQFVDREVL